MPLQGVNFPFFATTPPWSSLRSDPAPSASFDHLVGAREQGRGHGEPQGPRGPEVDDELELGRLLDWQVARLRALEDAIDEVGAATKHVGIVRPIRDETAGINEFLGG